MGAVHGPKICNCDIQEAIDIYESRYNEIINKNLSDKKLETELTLYVDSLNSFIGGNNKEKIKNLNLGKYSIKVETNAGRGFYRLALEKRKENEEVGATQEQIIKLQKFVEYLELEESIVRLKKCERNRAWAFLIFIPILTYIIGFVLYKNHPILKIIVTLFAVILFILTTMNIFDVTIFLKNNKK